jgi:hypothetical protein
MSHPSRVSLFASVLAIEYAPNTALLKNDRARGQVRLSDTRRRQTYRKRIISPASWRQNPPQTPAVPATHHPDTVLNDHAVDLNHWPKLNPGLQNSGIPRHATAVNHWHTVIQNCRGSSGSREELQGNSTRRSPIGSHQCCASPSAISCLRPPRQSDAKASCVDHRPWTQMGSPCNQDRVSANWPGSYSGHDWRRALAEYDNN